MKINAIKGKVFAFPKEQESSDEEYVIKQKKVYEIKQFSKWTKTEN